MNKFIHSFLIIIMSIFYISTITSFDYDKNTEIITKGEIERQVIALNKVSSDRQIQYYNINHYTDLRLMNSITVDQINDILEYWNYYSDEDIPFRHNGQIFIDAAIETGLDPVYILAHAGLESAWGTSYYAKNYHNYFGIGAFDYNPDNAMNYSNNNMRDGIIEGAKWIKENYYNTGQNCVYSMRYNNGYNEYCTSDTWADEIVNIIQTSYSLISS